MALVDGITGQALQTLAITTLRRAGTLAADRVYEQRDWPTAPGLMPAILVKLVKERCVSLSRNGPYSFNTTMLLLVIARQVGTAPEAVGADLLTMAEQIKASFLGTYDFNRYVQQFASIEAENVVSSDGKLQVGEVGMHFEIEVFQEYGPDDATPLIEIHGTITNPATGAAFATFRADPQSS